MIEVSPQVFVGSGDDLIHVDDGNRGIKDGWFVVSAAKSFHRDELGYKGWAAPKDSPEYLIAKRGRRLFLNLIDADDPKFIPDAIMSAATDAIDLIRPSGENVLIHCNQGQSRAPAIAMLWMKRNGLLEGTTYDEQAESFRKVYPAFQPGKGIEGYLRAQYPMTVQWSKAEDPTNWEAT